MTKNQKRRFKQMYESGIRLVVITRELGIPYEDASALISEMGLAPRRERHRDENGKLIAPDGMLEDAKALALPELSAKYQISASTISRILQENGVKAINGEAKRKRLGLSRTQSLATSANRTLDRAANHLRRFRANVHRCDIRMYEASRSTWGDVRGVPNSGVGYYYVDGTGIISSEEMLAMSIRFGFREEPDFVVAENMV